MSEKQLNKNVKIKRKIKKCINNQFIKKSKKVNHKINILSQYKKE